MRIVILGGPLTGKTTLARSLLEEAAELHEFYTDSAPQTPLFCSSDDYVDLDWSEQSRVVAREMRKHSSWVWEGCAMDRGLRKFMEQSDEKPCDLVIHLRRPYVSQTKEQRSMHKGIETRFAAIKPELLKRGVRVVEEV